MIKELLLKIICSKYFLLLLVFLIGVFSTYLLGDDNPIEEYSELIIKTETGFDIDLTPNSLIYSPVFRHGEYIKQGANILRGDPWVAKE